MIDVKEKIKKKRYNFFSFKLKNVEAECEDGDD